MHYPMEPQEMGLWCWAAVSLSIDRYFNNVSTRSQCSIASAIKEMNCCNHPPACNAVAELHHALIHVGRFQRMFAGRLTFQAVRNSIRAGFPVCVRIGWWPSGGHYVVITGYSVTDAGEPFVTISDPLYESGSWPYDEFAFSYFGIGRWTHTYLV